MAGITLQVLQVSYILSSCSHFMILLWATTNPIKAANNCQRSWHTAVPELSPENEVNTCLALPHAGWYKVRARVVTASTAPRLIEKVAGIDCIMHWFSNAAYKYKAFVCTVQYILKSWDIPY
jgi:hypothetical protein